MNMRCLTTVSVSLHHGSELDRSLLYGDPCNAKHPKRTACSQGGTIGSDRRRPCPRFRRLLPPYGATAVTLPLAMLSGWGWPRQEGCLLGRLCVGSGQPCTPVMGRAALPPPATCQCSQLRTLTPCSAALIRRAITCRILHQRDSLQEPAYFQLATLAGRSGDGRGCAVQPDG